MNAEVQEFYDRIVKHPNFPSPTEYNEEERYVGLADIMQEMLDRADTLTLVVLNEMVEHPMLPEITTVAEALSDCCIHSLYQFWTETLRNAGPPENWELMDQETSQRITNKAIDLYLEGL